MANANLYTFAKRKNSTLLPSVSPSVIDVQLKSGTSLISPTFLLNYSGRPTFNYIGFEGRYYFVNDITSVRNDLWEIACTEDFLASWKSDIGSTTAMILYATGGSSNIIDTRIPTTADVSITNATGTITGFNILDDTSGAVILSIVGTGSFGVYLLKDSTAVKELMSNVTIYTAARVTDLVTGFQQMLSDGNIGQNIKAAISLPIMWTPSGASSALYLGDYPCTYSGGQAIEGYNLQGEYIVKGDSNVSIPWGRSDWLKNAPYTEVYLYVPFIGTMSLPTNDIINNTSLDVEFSINVTSGDVAVLVSGHNDGKFIATASANIAMSTPYGSSNINSGKVASAVVTGAAGVLGALAATNPITAVAALGGGLAASAGQMLNAWHGETAGGGGLGGGASHGLYKFVRCSVVKHNLTDSQANVNPIMGKPVMAKHTIGSYSGYVQCDGAEVAGNMLDQERETINNLLNGGIYYE